MNWVLMTTDKVQVLIVDVHHFLLILHKICKDTLLDYTFSVYLYLLDLPCCQIDIILLYLP